MGFGGKKVKTKPATDLQLQEASSTHPVTWARGMSRLYPVLIDYTDFKATKHKQKTGKGMGGSVNTYTYSATVVLELCEGEIVGVGKGWKDKGEVADYSEFGFTLATGMTPQAAWGYMSTAHPDHALGYPGTALLMKAHLELGDTASMGFYSFETQAGLYGTGPGGSPDADPALLVLDFLTDVQSGAQFPSAFIDEDQLLSTVDAASPGDSSYQTYCAAMGFGLSPALDQQEAAGDVLERWAMLTNSAAVSTGYSFKLVPYADEAVTGNGVTFLPDTAVRFDLTDSDFPGSKGAVVEETVGDPADVKNVQKLEIRDRGNAYTPVPVPWQDQVSIETLGRREGEVIQGHEICEPAMAGQVVALIGQRVVNIRNSYRFPLGPLKAVLEPMDVVTLTCVELGLVELPVRILTIEEDEDDNLSIEAEEFPGAVGHTITTAGAGGTPEVVNSLNPPGPVNPPIILEPPSTLSGGVPQVWAAVSGGDGTTADPNWGGCTVYASTDDISYQAIGVIETPARMGVLATAAASYAGANPQASSFDANLAMSAGELQDVSEDEAAAGDTLCWVEDAAGGNGEFLSFRDATLVSGNRYTLGGSLYRRLYGTAGPAHAIGSKFARLDGNIFKYDLPAAWIGQTLYFKFPSFNIWGAAEEDVASLSAYTFVPAGVGFGGGAAGVPTTPTGLSASADLTTVGLTWAANPASDNVTGYRLYRAAGTGALFGAAVLIATTAGLSWPDVGLTVSTGYTYFVVAENAAGLSVESAGVNATTDTPAVVPVPWGFGFDVAVPSNPSVVIAEFVTDIAWSMPAGLPDAAAKVTGTAPSADTDFDIQVAGVSVGTMRCPSGLTTFVFIKAATSAVASSATVQLVAPASLNGMNGRIFGSIVGER